MATQEIGFRVDFHHFIPACGSPPHTRCALFLYSGTSWMIIFNTECEHQIIQHMIYHIIINYLYDRGYYRQPLTNPQTTALPPTGSRVRICQLIRGVCMQVHRLLFCLETSPPSNGRLFAVHPHAPPQMATPDSETRGWPLSAEPQSPSPNSLSCEPLARGSH
jgi:hypothetical protein